MTACNLIIIGSVLVVVPLPLANQELIQEFIHFHVYFNFLNEHAHMVVSPFGIG